MQDNYRRVWRAAYQHASLHAMGIKHRSEAEKRPSELNRLITAAYAGFESEPSSWMTTVGRALHGWFAGHGRSFHWRDVSDSYQVLISEIFLRKTMAPVAHRLLLEFFARYPSATQLAQANSDDLTTLLGPLGLSRQRGSQLQALGQKLVVDYKSETPIQVVDLLRLPGVGPYTAAMVAATCAAERIPAVDTNVGRVLCRVFGLTPSNSEARKSPNIWNTAGELLRNWPGSPAEFNWAILDLGALICTARRPRCSACPLQPHCMYARDPKV